MTPAATDTQPVGSGVVYGPTALAVSLLSLDEFRQVAETLGAMEKSRQWWIGDLLVYGETTFDEPEFLDALDAFGLAPHTLVNYRSICSRVPAAARRESLSFSIHAEVAYLEPDERNEWLDVAERDGLGVRELRELLRPGSGRQADGPEPAPELTPAEDVDVQRRLERLSRAVENGVRYEDASGETTVEDVVWVVRLATRLARGGHG